MTSGSFNLPNGNSTFRYSQKSVVTLHIGFLYFDMRRKVKNKIKFIVDGLIISY